MQALSFFAYFADRITRGGDCFEDWEIRSGFV